MMSSGMLALSMTDAEAHFSSQQKQQYCQTFGLSIQIKSLDTRNNFDLDH